MIEELFRKKIHYLESKLFWCKIIYFNIEKNFYPYGCYVQTTAGNINANKAVFKAGSVSTGYRKTGSYILTSSV